MGSAKKDHSLIERFSAQWGVPKDAVKRLLEQWKTIGAETAEAAFSDTVSNADFAAIIRFEEGDSGTSPSDDVVRDQSSMVGRYQDLGLIGVGSMGEVRLVRDPKLRRTLAMKILHQHLLDAPRTVARFIEEAQVEAQLQHQNIVPVYELGCLPDGRHYFTMKQISGTEFSTHISTVHAQSVADRWHPGSDGTTFRDLLRTLLQVSETVAFAHAQGVIHRDLKPQNIMIGEYGEVLVVDWGLAKVIGAEEKSWMPDSDDHIETDRSASDALQTRIGSVAGTPCYMAPEQAHGWTEKVGLPADVYALGAILYEILSGTPPFWGDSVDEVLEQVKHGTPKGLLAETDASTHPQTESSEDQSAPAQSVGASKIPTQLVAICNAAMVRSLDDRTTTARQFADAIKAWLEGAERRDKGLEEVAAARILREESREAHREAAREWTRAETTIERDGSHSESGWTHWERFGEATSRARELSRESTRRLEGALVHAPDLIEAHEALAEVRVGELIEAAAIGDGSTQEAVQRQLDTHLLVLPDSVADRIRAQLDSELGDTVGGRRRRRGAMIGRKDLQKSVIQAIDTGRRLVTLLGTAGVGKTRLALELADELRPRFSRAVFCDLTEATDELEVALQLSRVLDVRLEDADPLGHLADVLALEPTVLVLDTLERLTSVMGPLASDWIRSCPELQIITTSRVKIGVDEETVISVQPMSLLESVALFVHRGRTVDHRFDLTEKNRDAVCRLVGELDGLPLAIELAAARLNLLTVDEVAQRLTERFSLLRSRDRDGQALGGALDWSWDLLNPWAKAALKQSSLFRGGFTLAAAEGVVVTGLNMDAPPMFEILGELVDGSLLRKDQTEAGGVRYSQLESIRVYAYGKLGSEGVQTVNQAKERHAAHFSTMGSAESLRALDGFHGGQRWAELFRDLDNLVVGAEYGTIGTAPLCCLAALKVLSMKGPMSLGVDIASEVLKRPGLAPRLQMLLEIERSRCLRISGRLAEARQTVTMGSLLGDDPVESTLDEEPETDEALGIATLLDDDPRETVDSSIGLIEAERLLRQSEIEWVENCFDEATECIEQALVLFRVHGGRSGEGQSLRVLGNVLRARGNIDEAIDHYRRALAINREVGDLREEGMNLANLGTVLQDRGHHDRAIEHYRRAIEIHEQIGDTIRKGIVLGNLGTVFQEKGDHGRAIEHFEQAIAIHRSTGDRRTEGVNLGNLANVYRSLGRMEDAIAQYLSAIDIHRSIGNRRSEGICTGNIGQAYALLGRTEEAESAFRRAIAFGDQYFPPAAGVARGDLGILLARAQRFEEAESLFEEGEKMVSQLPDENAIFHCKRGFASLEAGDISRAQEAMARAQTIAASLTFAESSDLADALRRLAAQFGPGEDRDHYLESTVEDRSSLALIEAHRQMELGRLEYDQGRYAESESCFQNVLSVYQRFGDRQGEAEVWGALGNLRRVQGQCAESHYKRSIAIFREIGNRLAEGNQLGNLGNSLRGSGQIMAAIAHYEESIQIANEIGNTRSEGIFTGNLGLAYRELDQFERALECQQNALALHRSVGDRRFEGIHLGNMGDTLALMGRDAEAQNAFRESIALSDANFPIAAGAFRGSLAVLLARTGEHDAAWKLIEEGEGLVKMNAEELIKFLCNKGLALLHMDEKEAAAASLNEAQDRASEVKARGGVEAVRALNKLATALGRTSPYDGDNSLEADDPTYEGAGEMHEASSDAALTQVWGEQAASTLLPSKTPGGK